MAFEVFMSDIESQMLKKGLIKVPIDEKSAGKESPYPSLQDTQKV